MARRDIDRRIFAAAIGNDGAVSRQQLLDLGISSTAISRRVAAGMIERVVAGYYVVPELGSPTSAASAILLAHPGGALSHGTATDRLGFSLGWGSDAPTAHVIVAHGASLQATGVTIHETRHLPSADVVVVGGQRVTSPARTVCDVASELSDRRLVHLVETQMAVRNPAPEELVACWEARRRGRVPGMGRLGRILAELVDDEPYPESRFEIEVLDGLRQLGLGGLHRQFRPPWYSGVRGIVDAADPTGRTIVECDGRRYRQITQAHDNDRHRDRVAASHGWATVRIGWRELQRDTDGVLREVVEIIELRRRQASDANLRPSPPQSAA